PRKFPKATISGGLPPGSSWPRAREPALRRLAIVISKERIASEQRPIVEAGRVDDGARARRGFLDRSDIDAAIPADHKIGGARPEPVEMHLRPIAGVDANEAVGIARRARVVSTAKRASA